MTNRPKLTVVGKGEPESEPQPDTALADCLKAALAKVEAGEVVGLFLAVLSHDDPVPDFHIPSADPLRTVSLVEIFLPDVKAVMLGFAE